MTLAAIAIPSHDGKIHLQTVTALYAGIDLIRNEGHNARVLTKRGDSLIVHARNVLVDSFLKTKADRLVFLDTDMMFLPESLKSIALSEEPVVGACYAQKEIDWKKLEKAVLAGKEHPQAWATSIHVGLKAKPQAKGSLVECLGLPTGFLSIRRDVIEKMVERNGFFVEREKPVPNVFRTEVSDGKFWGEDFLFCNEVRELGFTIWLDTSIRLGHIGEMVYHANLESKGEW